MTTEPTPIRCGPSRAAVAATVAASLLAAGCTALAQPDRDPPPRLPRQPRAIEHLLPPDADIARDVVYGPEADRHRLDIVFRPADPTPRPAIVMFHGGGFVAGQKETMQRQLVELARRGFVTVAVEFRLPPQHPFPDPVHDAKRAIRWLRTHAADYHIDPDRIGALGNSSGGTLAAMLALSGPDDGLDDPADQPATVSSAVRCAATTAAPFDFRPESGLDYGSAGVDGIRAFLGQSPQDDPERARRASPITYVSPGDAPLLIIHAEGDRVVDPRNAHAMAQALQQAGVHHRLLLIPDARHNIGPLPHVREQVAQFFESCLGPVPPARATTR